MARFMARNSKWPENIFYGQRGANMARFEKSGHQMANLAALTATGKLLLDGRLRLEIVNKIDATADNRF